MIPMPPEIKDEIMARVAPLRAENLRALHGGHEDELRGRDYDNCGPYFDAAYRSARRLTGRLRFAREHGCDDSSKLLEDRLARLLDGAQQCPA